jgi:hypothetical protein
LLAGPQDARNFGDGAPDDIRVHPSGHPADVRQLGKAGQSTATEVKAVELQLLRGVGGGGRQDQ